MLILSGRVDSLKINAHPKLVKTVLLIKLVLMWVGLEGELNGS